MTEYVTDEANLLHDIRNLLGKLVEQTKEPEYVHLLNPKLPPPPAPPLAAWLTDHDTFQWVTTDSDMIKHGWRRLYVETHPPRDGSYIEDAARTVSEARNRLAMRLVQVCPLPHVFVQHQDHLPPWCDACRYTALGQKITAPPVASEMGE